MSKNIKSSFEISYVSKDLIFVQIVNQLLTDKLDEICDFLSRVTKSKVYWHKNVQFDYCSIYTESSNLDSVRKELSDYEKSYMSTLRKHELIAKHKHLK